MKEFYIITKNENGELEENYVIGEKKSVVKKNLSEVTNLIHIEEVPIITDTIDNIKTLITKLTENATLEEKTIINYILTLF